ncbi:hypothetical protein [Nonomuraea sp. NPDC005650]|uniref:hypothetical protein n=1 Tax=Nonomuraea sp. NPDC005650 TaxID=3157045 RepID=UPI0033AC5687
MLLLPASRCPRCLGAGLVRWWKGTDSPSAGALSALALLGHPAGAGLFQQVIMQSIPAGVQPYEPREAAEIGRRLLDVLDLRTEEAERLRAKEAGGLRTEEAEQLRAEEAELLRTVAVSQLLAAQGELARRMAAPLTMTPPFQLVADGGVPADLLADAPGDMPVLIGTTRDEARSFFPEAPADVTDRFFGAGSLRLARQARLAFAYRFDWSPPGSAFGACHCIELPFVFGDLDAWRAAPMLAGADPADLGQLVDEVQHAWAGFVHAGSPGWSPYPHVRHFT